MKKPEVILYGVRHIDTGRYWKGRKSVYHPHGTGTWALHEALTFTTKDKRVGKCYDSKNRTVSIFKEFLTENNKNPSGVKYELSEFELVVFTENQTQGIL
jgi:hypothetical protein